MRLHFRLLRLGLILFLLMVARFSPINKRRAILLGIGYFS